MAQVVSLQSSLFSTRAPSDFQPVCRRTLVGEIVRFAVGNDLISSDAPMYRPNIGSGRGRRRRLWTLVGTFSRITSATAPAGETLRSRGGPPLAVHLGWRLAADLELVRTRGIRLFN
ncbi:unnamed protein product [Pleuronectes platessa]|uniref:Uncharacterized protein n=1 Tax=Pleuronectes platessa TaxID=8262 RepID=A0A9N7U7Z1_PLEPL|nr:unnamed protein product [Pleuronectes platessa]